MHIYSALAKVLTHDCGSFVRYLAPTTRQTDELGPKLECKTFNMGSASGYNLDDFWQRIFDSFAFQLCA